MESLLSRKELSFVFVGGKGGVGKTTNSAAIAIQFSYDRKVLLLSTDPAHSLSDAFRLQFTGTPQKVSPNLEVMEVNPETALRAEVAKWTAMASESGFDDLIENVKEFQEWLLGIPGIDEATALANVISYIESGEYDVIVFDTAPTGHTLKLLNLPKVLQLGLDKLASWQSKLWGVWQVMKGKGNPAQMQKTVSDRLMQYKQGVEKIAVMLQDNRRTNFTVVCIAEHLSINESCRLLAELKKNGVGVSHVIVNQLVTQALQTEEFAAFDALLARCVPSAEEELLLQRVRASVQLTNARRNIQQKYMQDLRNAPETEGLSIVEVPLLPSEVTGLAALLNFSQRLVAPGFRPLEQAPAELVGWVPHPAPLAMPPAEEGGGERKEGEGEKKQEEQGGDKPVPMQDEETKQEKPQEERAQLPAIGSAVIIKNLVKAPQYNGKKGRVVSHLADGRVGVTLGTKTISFQPANLQPEEEGEQAATIHASPQASAASPADATKNALEAKLLADPEFAEAMKKPRFKAAFDDLKANPGKFFQYMSDPELGPFCSKMMAKMMGGK